MSYPAPIFRQRASQHGVSLVELMVAMTIGLILLAAVAYLFIGTSQTSRTQDDLSRLQETGRIALDVVGQMVRHAKYVETPNADEPAISWKPNWELSHPGVAWLVTSNGAGTAADSITVRFEPVSAGDTDCTGANVVNAALPHSNLVQATLSINGSNELVCNNGSTTATLFSDIENMQITYGIDTSGDFAADSYVDTPANINQVVAIRVSLLARSRDDASPMTQTYTYNGSTVTATDKRLRQEFVTTYALRNLVP
jgi:type IV pilus assembly protein PilW